MKLTEKEMVKRGEMLAEILMLRKAIGLDRPPRYQTSWGTKTALGIYLTVARIVEKGE